MNRSGWIIRGKLLSTLLLWGATAAFSQVKSKEVGSGASKPTVYIEYVKSGPRMPLHTDESDRGVWMRLHNNSRWTLIVPTFEVPRANGEAGLFYEVRLIPGSPVSTPPVGEPLAHIQSMSTIRPGRFLEFSVPTEQLASGLEIAVRFNYEWESQLLIAQGNEPEHRVLFELKNPGTK